MKIKKFRLKNSSNRSGFFRLKGKADNQHGRKTDDGRKQIGWNESSRNENSRIENSRIEKS